MTTTITPPTWEDFERRVLNMAEAYSIARSDAYHHQTPADLHRDLCRIERAIQQTLQVLVPLNLSHREGQDLIAEPFNWPLIQELRSGRVSLEIMRMKMPPEPGFEVSAYPSKLISDLIELRDAARFAAASVKPSRGQSKDRDPNSRDAANIARNLVFWHRATFSVMPAMSKTGRVVDLLQRCLDAAGLSSFDAARLLQTAIERDEIGRSLPPPAKVIRNRGKHGK